MKGHPNGQGHHPKVRPWIRHALYSVSLKVLRRLSPKVMLLFASDDELLEPMVVEMGCADSGMWYVDTAGCATLQANDANPPPRQCFVRTAMQYAAVLLLGLMMLVGSASCKKDPQPNPAPNPVPTDTVTPITPVDTITPIVPGDTITPTSGDTIVPEPPVPTDTVKLFINLKNENIQYPSIDTLRELVELNKVIVLRWKIPPNMTAYWTPKHFHPPRDTLKARFALSENIIGSGKIYVNKNYGGASIPCEDSLTISKLGMTECDSAIFAGWGFEPYVKYSKSQRDEHSQMLDTIGMSRAIFGKQH